MAFSIAYVVALSSIIMIKSCSVLHNKRKTANINGKIPEFLPGRKSQCSHTSKTANIKSCYAPAPHTRLSCYTYTGLFNRTFWDPTTQWIALTSEHQRIGTCIYYYAYMRVLKEPHVNVISLRHTFLIPLTTISDEHHWPIYNHYSCHQCWGLFSNLIPRCFWP